MQPISEPPKSYKDECEGLVKDEAALRSLCCTLWEKDYIVEVSGQNELEILYNFACLPKVDWKIIVERDKSVNKLKYTVDLFKPDSYSDSELVKIYRILLRTFSEYSRLKPTEYTTKNEEDIDGLMCWTELEDNVENLGDNYVNFTEVLLDLSDIICKFSINIKVE